MGNEVFEVGKPYLPLSGKGEGVRFSIDASGCIMTYSFDRPTADEIKAMGPNSPFEIRFLTLGGIIWVLSKCGSLNWVDAPYNPRLSSGLPRIDSIPDRSGLGLTLIMLDSRDAIVKSVRLIGLGTEFSRRLIKEAWNVRQKTMTIAECNMSIAKTMDSFSTDSLVRMANSARFKL